MLGHLAPLEQSAADARARLLLHEIESDIVVVGIDANSLAELQQWPWPRRLHAQLINRLNEAAPRQVFIDIDFSSRSNSEDDALLEAALADWKGAPIILPAFFQQRSGTDSAVSLTQPLEQLARHAALGSVNQQISSDGRVREFRGSWSVDGYTLPSAIASAAGTPLPAEGDLPIDFSIAPSSFASISYVDLLNGRVASSELDGKTILIGATAIELGDMVPVPVYRSLPGVIVQALAIQTARQGALRPVPVWLYLPLLAVWATLCAALFHARSWRWNLIAVAGALVLAGTASLYAYSAHRVTLDLAPLFLVAVGAFLIVTIQSLDQQTMRAIAYALGLKRRDALLKSIVESSMDCIVCIDQKGQIQTANPAAARLFGCVPARLIGAPLAEFVPMLAMEPAAQALESLAGAVSEYEARTLDDRAFPVEMSVSRVQLSDELLYTAIVRDISERKAQQRELQHQATHDPLTSLPNRTALARHLGNALAQARPEQSVALLLLDLSRFKEVNDTLGHGVGDNVLCEVARRFRATLAERGFIARVGGDEFTIVLEGLEDESVIASLSQGLVDSLREPIDTGAISIEVGVSIGVARFPRDAEDAQTLLQHADVAMYVAKRRGSPYELYDPAHDQNSIRRLAMVGELRSAIATSTISLHYQPQVDLRTGLVTGAEALLRWEHPTLGRVNPDEFIGVAESTDLIMPLTEWTLIEALNQIARWRQSGFELSVAVNLSARMLQDTTFPERLRKLLESSEAGVDLLELEITESAMLLDPARALRVIRQIDELGVRIAIDDFGTGFSSLSYLRDLPVRSLKIDKSFTMSMREHESERVIVESTVQMAHALKLQVVAEGVETEWEAQFLASIGCDYGQGYTYSRALPPDECRAWIDRFNAGQRDTSGKIRSAG